mgnify:CR=1 FL=1
MLALAVAGYFYGRYRYYSKDDPAKWEKEVESIEARTGSTPHRGKAVVFIGSSSIKFWESLATDMAPLPVLNHGFGGSRIKDAAHYVPRLVSAYRPPVVVFYAGDNDVYLRDLLGAKPGTAESCLEDFRAFAAAVHRDLPRAKILFISIKPSVSRMKHWPVMKKANELIRDFCETDGRLVYVDIAAAMMTDGGAPRKEHFSGDGLHLNAEGYRLWAGIVKPAVEKHYPAALR